MHGTDARTIQADLLCLTYLAILQYHAADVGVLDEDISILAAAREGRG